MEKPTTPCKWCGTETTMLGTKDCDFCWEMHHRIEHKPAVAIKMLINIFFKKLTGRV